MGYLICGNCKGFYKLHPGEKPDDFNGTCTCGGNLRYSMDIEVVGNQQLDHYYQNSDSKNHKENNNEHLTTTKTFNNNQNHDESFNNNQTNENLMQCPDCGYKISKTAKICPNCGKKQKQAKNVSPIIAGILGFALGPFGYIYLDKWKGLVFGIIMAILLYAFLNIIGTFVAAIFFTITQYYLAKEMKEEYIKRYGEKVR